MLGLLHRVTIGEGPPHFKKHFIVEEGRKLKDPRKVFKGPLVNRSVLGLVAIYNMTPQQCRDETIVQGFQSQLQALLKERVAEGCENWIDTFSPRLAVGTHPLKR